MKVHLERKRLATGLKNYRYSVSGIIDAENLPYFWS